VFPVATVPKDVDARATPKQGGPEDGRCSHAPAALLGFCVVTQAEPKRAVQPYGRILPPKASQGNTPGSPDQLVFALALVQRDLALAELRRRLSPAQDLGKGRGSHLPRSIPSDAPHIARQGGAAIA